MAKTSWHPDLTKYNKFEEELLLETDRGAAVMACTMLDWVFKRMLGNFLVKSKITEELFDGANAPLSSFSNKIKMSYSLGLITQLEYHDINILRRIRNEFAHKFELNFSFEDHKVSSICKNLILQEDWNGKMIEGTRNLYINSSLVMIKCLLFRREGGDDRIEEEGNVR